MENQYAQHIYFDRPREGAPDFVKGRMSMKRDDAIEYLKTLNASEKGYVYFDLLVSKDGSKLYWKLNDYQPAPKKENESVAPDFPEEEIRPEDIPF